MTSILIKVVSYDKDINCCTAECNGVMVEFDPYVLCALPLSDEEYQKGQGAQIVGNTYIVSDYFTISDIICPKQNGMTLHV
jgi:hypothetical protein